MTTTVLPSRTSSDEELEELADVVEMEAGRRLVEEVERPSRGPPAELLGQLDPLGLAAREGAAPAGRAGCSPARPPERGQLAA